MPPQTPDPPPNYDFFLNPTAAPKRRLLPTPTSFKQRLLVTAIGAMVFIILVIVLLSTVFGNHTSVTGLVTIAQEQNELIRVATEGFTNASQQTAKDLAINVELSVTTDQQELLAYLKTVGKTPSTKTLAAAYNANTDSQLNAAQVASNYDLTLSQIFKNELSTYSQTLQQTFASTTLTSQRKLISQDYSAANILIKQADAAIQNPSI